MARGLKDYMDLGTEMPMLSQTEPGFNPMQAPSYEDEIGSVVDELMMAEQMQEQAASIDPQGLGAYMPAEPAQMQMDSALMREQLADQEAAQEMTQKAALAEEQGIKQLEQYITDYSKKPQGIDFTALAGYLDSWRGGKTMDAALATRGDTPDEKAQKLMGLQNMLVQRRQAQAKRFQDGGRQKRFETSTDLKKEDNIRKDVNKIADGYQKTQGDLDVATTAVRNGDTRTVQMVISSIARNIGEQKGALSDGDVARSLPPDVATTVAGLEAWLGRPDAKISGPLQNALLGLINRARGNSQKLFGEGMNRRRKQYSAGAYAPLMQQGQVGDVIFNEAMGLGGGEQPPLEIPQPARKKSSTNTSAAPGGGPVSPQEWLKRKRAKGG